MLSLGMTLHRHLSVAPKHAGSRFAALMDGGGGPISPSASSASLSSPAAASSSSASASASAADRFTINLFHADWSPVLQPIVCSGSSGPLALRLSTEKIQV
jgi:hypothetical protein